MCCSKLSMLYDKYEQESLAVVFNWLHNLSPSAQRVITVSKMIAATGLDFSLGQSILNDMVEISLLQRRFVIRCPNCNLAATTLHDNNLSEALSREFDCYSCDYHDSISFDDIDVFYEYLKPPVPPIDPTGNANKRTFEDDDATSISQTDDLTSLINVGFNVHQLLYCPNDREYDCLAKLFNSVFIKQRNTKIKGDTLESLTIYLFNLCKVFTAKGIRTKTNQIDCAVHIKASGITCSVFKHLSKLIIIECKNENKTPNVGYFQKLQSIISMMNNKTGLVNMGILCSIARPPKTYMQLSNNYYLAHNIIALTFCKDDFIKLIHDRVNLLDLIEDKTLQVITDSKVTFMPSTLKNLSEQL